VSIGKSDVTEKIFMKMSFAIPLQVHPDAVTQIFFLLMYKDLVNISLSYVIFKIVVLR